MTLRRYLAHFRPHASMLALATVLLALSSALPASTVLLLQHTVDEVIASGDRSALPWVCLGFVAIAAARAGAIVIRTWLTKRVGWQVASELRRRLHGQLLRLDPGSPVGSRLSALTHEVDEVQYGVSAIVTAIRNPLTLLSLGLSAGWMAPQLAPWALLLVPLVAWTAARTGTRVHRSASDSRAARAELTGLAGDQLLAADAIAAVNGAAAEEARFAVADDRDRRARVHLEVERTVPSAATQVVVACAGGVLLWLGAGRVLSGELQPGQFLGFAVALGLMHRPLSGLSEVWSLLQRSLAALERVYGVLDLPLPVEPTHPVAVPEGRSALVVRGVHARYGEGDQVLSGVSLTVAPGEIVALTGVSGAGKSTLLDVIRGVIPPTAGEVLLGGVDLATVLRADRARAIGWVSQDNRLLNRTVAENVRLGREASDHAVREALRKSGATFVDRLPEGIESQVGERGQLLSGGERQRLCIARALLHDPPVLLLDEATNQLDPEVERTIVATLRREVSDCAILLIAHDAATAELADRAIALDGGRIRAELTAGPRVVA